MPLRVVEAHPVVDLSGLEAVSNLMQIDCLIFQESPWPLDEDIVQISAPPIHIDFDVGLLHYREPICHKILATLIYIYYLSPAIFGDGFANTLMQKLASIVFDNCQDRTLSIAQSMVATR